MSACIHFLVYVRRCSRLRPCPQTSSASFKISRAWTLRIVVNMLLIYIFAPTCSQISWQARVLFNTASPACALSLFSYWLKNLSSAGDEAVQISKKSVWSSDQESAPLPLSEDLCCHGCSFAWPILNCQVRTYRNSSNATWWPQWQWALSQAKISAAGGLLLL